MDLIDVRCDAETIAEENPSNWLALANDIELALRQVEDVDDPDSGKIEEARQLALGIISAPQNRVSYAQSIKELVQDVIANRMKSIDVTTIKP